MRKSSLAVLGAAFLAGATALPAKADVHQIGSVNVAADHYTDISWEHFEGAVERLQFVAQGDTIVATGDVSFEVRETGKAGSSKWVYIWKLANGQVQSYDQFNDPGLAEAFS